LSAIFGLIRFDGAAALPEQLTCMGAVLANWGPDGQVPWTEGSAGLGCLRLHTTPESIHERQPRQMANGAWLVSAARLDNRADLCRALGVPAAEQTCLPDGDLIERAYLRWGEACVERLLGDWSFAVWDPAARRLFLARDHFGNTGLYYHASPAAIAFASGRKALLALDPHLSEVDDLFVAQVLLAWPVYHGERTAHARLRRLPPAHTLAATPRGTTTRLYWRMQDAPLLPLRSLDEAAEGLRAVFDEAVGSRLRAGESHGLALTLSGGLDSGALTATAAHLLAGTGRPLRAYTSVPVAAPGVYLNGERRFGDEWPLAAATARCAAQVMGGALDHVSIRAEAMGVLDGIERSLQIHDEPGHSAGNAYWMLDLLRQARQDGAKLLITGQGGNASISWTGFRGSWPRSAWGRLQPAGQETAVRWRQRLLLALPRAWGTAVRVARARRAERWRDNTALNPDLARRLDVAGRSSEQFALEAASLTPLGARFRILGPGASLLGSRAAEWSAAEGLEARDPTLDVRVLAFCLGIPDRLFMDPASGLDRMVIRAAMAGRLPDEVRLNRRRGRQAADLVVRLRREREAVEACLAELEAGPAAGYVSLPALRRSWAAVQAHDDPPALAAAITVLTRGLMAGRFVHRNAAWRSGQAVRHGAALPVASP
jgi:asparagine synthase (glutamine-hydrolysing)